MYSTGEILDKPKLLSPWVTGMFSPNLMANWIPWWGPPSRGWGGWQGLLEDTVAILIMFGGLPQGGMGLSNQLPALSLVLLSRM